MLKQESRIYLATFVSSFGSWLTFLAIALLVKEHYGASQVAIVFLAQTLPAVLFSRTLAHLVPSHAKSRTYAGTQLLLALNSLFLCFTQNLPALYAHLFLGALCRAMAVPLFNSLLAEWVPGEKQSRLFTKVGALQAGTLALAPALGAWIKVTASAELLFFVDFLSFLAALVVLLPELLRPTEKIGEPNPWSWRALFLSISPRPRNIPREVVGPLAAWLLFLAVGALLNSVEFPVFEIAGLSERQIGIALAAWGLGNVAAFFLASTGARFGYAVAYAAALAFFVMARSFEAVALSFLLAGAVYSLLSGALRAALQLSVPPGYDPLPIWAWANQLTQLLNLVAYAACGALLRVIGPEWIGALLVLCALAVAIQCSPVFLSEARSRSAMLLSASRPKK